MAMVCALCGKQISGKYTIDFWGNPYCYSHKNRERLCDYCGRYIGPKSTGGGSIYPNGRRICGICKSDVIEERDRGLKILKTIHQLLEDEGIIISPFKPEFALLERAKGTRRREGEEQGLARYTREKLGGEIQWFKMEIFILKGLPKINFISACAHELMHIWFYSHNMTSASPQLSEGSCNMASYLILKKMKTKEAEYLIKGFFENKNHAYGGGFRKVHRLVEKKGIEGWLDYALKHKKI